MSSHSLPPHLDPRGRRSSGTVARVASLKPVGRVLAAMLSIGLLVLAGYTWYQFRELDQGLTRLPISTRGEQGKQQPPDIDGEDQNILVVGNDDRSNMTDAEVRELHVGKDGGSLATDTMMIVHVPADGSKATLISLPRDTRVRIPGYGIGLLNSAYANGYVAAQENNRASKDEARTAGANLLLSTIRNLTGLTFDHYVQVDLLGFYRIAKAIGKIPVNMCNAVDDRVKTNIANGEGVAGSGLVLPKGRSEITGVQALEFVRQRHGLDGGDFDRVKRQQYFLTAAFRQVASVGVLTKLRELGDALKRSVYFDSELELIPLAKQMQNLTADNIVGRTIPVDIRTGYQNPAQVRKFVDNLINPSTSTPAPKSSNTKGNGGPRKSTGRSPIDAKCIS